MIQVHRGLASLDAPDPMVPSGKTTTAISVFREAIRIGKEYVGKLVDMAKSMMNRYAIAFSFKVQIGFLEIAVVPRLIPAKSYSCV